MMDGFGNMGGGMWGMGGIGLLVLILIVLGHCRSTEISAQMTRADAMACVTR